MRAYYCDDLPGDLRLPHDSGKPASNAALAAVGVYLWHVPVAKSLETDFVEVDKIARDRDYRTIETMTVTKESLGAELYEKSLKIFESEHMHEEEEIRYVLEGGGYFDVHENATNRWIRFIVNAGDVILLPSGIYHRFTLDDRNFIKARLFFHTREKWVPHYRGEQTEENPFRVEYVKTHQSIVVN